MLRAALLVPLLSLAPLLGTGLSPSAPAPRQDSGFLSDDADGERVRCERALISVDRKNARGKGIGLWLRECDGEMRRLWDGEPYDASSLLDRTILVAERWSGRVARIDRSGKVLFQKVGFDRPVDIDLAYDGTLVVVENGTGSVIGLDPKTGERRWVRKGFANPFDAAPLPDGGLLVADSGRNRIVELSPEGAVRRTIPGFRFPNTVDALQDGHMLVTTWDGGEVFEVDAKSRIVWRVRVGGTLYRAERRLDGLTQVADAHGKIFVIDRDGKVVHRERFQPGCVDYETIREL